MYDLHNIAIAIKELAKTKGVVIKTMLSELGLGSNTMSALYHGKSIASSSLAKIADYLECSVDELLGRAENKSAPSQYLPGAAVIGLGGEQFVNHYENADLADELFILSEGLNRKKFEALVSIAKSIEKMDENKLQSLSDIAQQLTK